MHGCMSARLYVFLCLFTLPETGYVRAVLVQLTAQLHVINTLKMATQHIQSQARPRAAVCI
jgi:hypothetical protein